MTPPYFEQSVEELVRRDPSYKTDAYVFVRDALMYTQWSLEREDERKGLNRHISGRELLRGARDFALLQYGPLASCVLKQWGIKTSQDIGRIVYLLIDSGVFSKDDSDSIHDFDGALNWKHALEAPFKPSPAASK